MSKPIAVVVPKDLYYHEIDYVRGLEARVAKLEAALKDVRIDFEMWHEKTSIAKIDAALDAPQ
jgi:hypothetical protein